jgi:hypothetical protein
MPRAEEPPSSVTLESRRRRMLEQSYALGSIFMTRLSSYAVCDSRIRAYCAADRIEYNDSRGHTQIKEDVVFLLLPLYRASRRRRLIIAVTHIWCDANAMTRFW